MGKGRLEAFSDGVIAVIITIMVLELKVPHGADLDAIQPMLPAFLGYVLSFVFIGIYWNNHHHLLHTVAHVDGKIMWANLHLLFWLSLVPVATGWLGDNPHAAVPTAIYGFLLFMCGFAYLFLSRSIIAHHGKDSELGRAVGNDVKGLASQVLYLTAIGFAFVVQWVSLVLYVAVAVMWFIPDRRISRTLAPDHDH